MRLRLFAQILPGVVTASVISALAIATTTSNLPSYAKGNKFSCTQDKGVPVTMVHTSLGNEAFIRWVVTDFKKFPPIKRCQIVSSRFQRYYDNGDLFITSRDNFDGYPVLCISNRKGDACTSDNILVTLPREADIGVVLKQMLAFRGGFGEGGGIPHAIK
ncbi:MAG: COP23 domain-containing protein [Rhizonema sp. PD37]|nr:COP23 domain-containing protein [Rhizonema sp. PD37]